MADVEGRMTIEEIDRIADRIGAGKYVIKSASGDYSCLDFVPVCGEARMPGYRGSFDTMVARIRVTAGGYQVWARERGGEYRDRITSDYEELIYWAFQESVECLARDHEGRYRVPGQDPGRTLRQRTVDLYAPISADCAKRYLKELYASEKFEEDPYDDDLAARGYHYKDLLSQGLSREVAWQQALEAYPPAEHTPVYPPFWAHRS